MTDILKMHAELQELYGELREGGYDYSPGKRAETYGELLTRLRMNKEAGEREHWEVLDHLPWKSWREGHLAKLPDKIPAGVRHDVKEELIDGLHFFLNELIAAGYESWDEVLAAYRVKHDENRRRLTSGY